MPTFLQVNISCFTRISQYLPVSSWIWECHSGQCRSVPVWSAVSKCSWLKVRRTRSKSFWLLDSWLLDSWLLDSLFIFGFKLFFMFVFIGISVNISWLMCLLSVFYFPVSAFISWLLSKSYQRLLSIPYWVYLLN